MTISLADAGSILLLLGVAILLLPLGKAEKPARYIVGGGLLLFGVLRFLDSFRASA